MSLPTGNTENLFNTIWRLLMRLTVIGLVFYAFIHLRAVIVTLLIGAIIGYVFEPMIVGLMRNRTYRRMQFVLKSFTGRNGNPPRLTFRSLRGAATVYVFIFSLIVVWKGTTLVASPFVAQIQDIISHKDEYVKMYNEKVSKEVRDKIEEKIKDEDFQKSLGDAALPIAMRGASALRNIVEIVLLPVLAFYFALDGRNLKREFLVLVPRRYFSETARMLYEFNAIMRSYVLGQFILCALAGIVVGLGLGALHVQYAFVLAVLAGVTRAIPVVGPIMGGVPIILMTWLGDPVNGMQKAIWVLAFFTFLHFAESKFIMPKLIGERMELHPLLVIVVLLVGGEIGGQLFSGTLGALLGMFFAAPVAAIVRIMIRRYILKKPMHPREGGHGHNGNGKRERAVAIIIPETGK